MKRFDFEQRSDAWWKIRRGIPTSSGAGKIISPAKGIYAAGADSYAAELIAGSLGWQRDFKGNSDIDRGNMLESEAQRWIKLRTGNVVSSVGFCLSDCGRYGASPDGMLDDGSPAEIKAPDIHTFIKWAVEGELPSDHKAQCHMHMHVTGADRCIFLAYTTNQYLENLMIEVRRDDFTRKLGECVEKFCDRLDALRRQLTGEEYEILFPTTPNREEQPA